MGKIGKGKQEVFKLLKRKVPKHIAISMDGFTEWSKREGKSTMIAHKRGYENVQSIIRAAFRLDVPVVTFFLLPSIDKLKKIKDPREYDKVMEMIYELFSNLIDEKILYENQVRVSVLGKWYDLSEEVVRPIKTILEQTKDYDKFFLNFCINYDGQQEIIDALRVLARKVEKIDPDKITKAVVKDNLYSSYFVPPDLIVKTSKDHSLNGFLLWDSAEAEIYFSDIDFPDFKRGEFLKALDWFQKK